MGLEKYQNGFQLAIHPDSLDEPYKWKKSKVVFVNSMSDLFHEDVPLSFMQEVFRVMRENPHHVFQVLTKRSSVLLEYDQKGALHWAPNIWVGVSVEDGRVLNRMNDLRQTNAHVKFLSCEPLIGPLDNLNLKGLDWVIVGGESGRRPRPMKPEWVDSIQKQCEDSGVAFFFKQWGGTSKKKTGRELNGRTYDEMPEMPEMFEPA